MRRMASIAPKLGVQVGASQDLALMREGMACSSLRGPGFNVVTHDTASVDPKDGVGVGTRCGVQCFHGTHHVGGCRQECWCMLSCAACDSGYQRCCMGHMVWP